MKKYLLGTTLIALFLVAVITGYIVSGGFKPWIVFTLCLIFITGIIDLISVSRGKSGIIMMFRNLWLNIRHNPKLILIAVPAIIIIFFAVPTLLRTAIFNQFTSKAYIIKESDNEISYSMCYIFGNADIENFHIELTDNEIAILNLTSQNIYYTCHVYTDTIDGHTDYRYSIPSNTFETFQHDIDYVLTQPPHTIKRENGETEFIYSLTLESM